MSIFNQASDFLGYRDCTNSSGAGYSCPDCIGNKGKPCRVNPRESDPQTGPMCGTCQSNWCGHSPHYSSSYDKHPSNCGLGILCREILCTMNKIQQKVAYDYIL